MIKNFKEVLILIATQKLTRFIFLSLGLENQCE